MNKSIFRNKGINSAILISICIFLILNFIGIKNILLFHFLVEILTIIIGTCLFMVVWILRDKIENGYFTILGIGLLFTAFFDLMHILTFEGIPIFKQASSNLSYYFYLAGRFIQAITFLTAPFGVGKHIKSYLVLSVYTILTVSLSILIIYRILPPLFSSLGFQTLFDNLLQIIIVFIFLFAFFHLYIKRESFEKQIAFIMLASTGLAIISEVFIALYTDNTHLVNIAGHNLKLLTYFMIYQIVLIIGITEPQEIFYRELQTSRTQLQDLFNNLSEGICIIDQREKIIFSNPAADTILLGPKGRLAGKNLSKLLPADPHQKFAEAINRIEEKSSGSFELEIVDHNQKTKSLMVFSSPRIIDGKIDGEFIIFHDISEPKANRISLEEAGRFYQTLFMDAPIRIWENDYSKVKKAIEELKKQGITDLHQYLEQNPNIVKKMAKLVVIRNYNKIVERTYARGNPPKRITSLPGIFWSKSYKAFIDELMIIASNKDSANYEMSTISAEGKIIYSNINMTALANENHDYSHVIISADDISEREEARLELQSSEKKFRLLAENSGVGIIYLDLDGNILYHNDKLLEHIGHVKESIGTNIHDLYNKEFSDRLLQRIKHVSNSNETPTYIEQVNLPGGKKWFSLTFTRIMDDANQCIGVQVISHDITQQRNLETQLESLARFPRENPNPVIRISKDGVVVYSNEGGFPILKVWSYEETSRVPDYVKSILNNCLKQNKIEVVEEKVGDRVFSLFLVPIPDMGYINIYGRDVTDLKKAEEKLYKYSQNLEQTVAEKTRELLSAQERLARQEKLAVMGQLASGVGHELRNPLAVINNAIYMLRLDLGKRDKKSIEYLEIIDQEVAASNKIITDLLTFARIKPATLNPTDLHVCLNDVLEKFVPPENVKVTKNLPDDLPWVIVDNKQIEQVIANLVTNAYQAIPKRGELIISSKVEKTMIRLDFTDDGIGIPAENLEKIFDPLFSTKVKGIGLGLTISKMLAEANGGKIKVKSTVNKGATFSLYLPRNK